MMKIQPMTSSGEVFMDESGNVSVVPLQIFQLESGMFILRIGRTTYWFNEDGSYDGVEVKCCDHGEAEKTHRLTVECQKNLGKLPAEPYFGEGSAGYRAERLSWH